MSHELNHDLYLPSGNFELHEVPINKFPFSGLLGMNIYYIGKVVIIINYVYAIE